MRAKRPGAGTFECPLIFACQTIDMRVVVLRHLEHALRDDPSRWPCAPLAAAPSGTVMYGQKSNASFGSIF
jgi:hypothetical protein